MTRVTVRLGEVSGALRLDEARQVVTTLLVKDDLAAELAANEAGLHLPPPGPEARDEWSPGDAGKLPQSISPPSRTRPP